MFALFRNKLHAQYRLTPKKYICYIIYVPQDSVCKIGRTCRLQYRLNNLRTGIYREHEVFVIHCRSGYESLTLERHFHKTLKGKHLMREWFEDVTPRDIQSLLVMPDYGHLLLVPHEAGSDEIPDTSRQPDELRYDIFLC